jgi:hypothetical protein
VSLYFWKESIQFQNLKSSITFVEWKNLFCIVGVLLYDVIPTQVAISFCEEAQCWIYMQTTISVGQRWVVLMWTCSDGDKTNIKSNLNHLEGIICVTFSLIDIFIWSESIVLIVTCMQV